MGTRNLTCVVVDDKFKVAQYCQWDGYPSGQGMTVLDFLRINQNKLKTFQLLVERLVEATDEQIKALWVSCGANPDSNEVSLDISDKMKLLHPQFQRCLGADILRMIMAGEINNVQCQTEFAGDSLFCEWAYVIDLTNQTFEVYKGFVKESHEHTERFTEYFQEKERGDQYYPVKLVTQWPLSSLPSNDEFLKLEEQSTEM